MTHTEEQLITDRPTNKKKNVLAYKPPPRL